MTKMIKLLQERLVLTLVTEIIDKKKAHFEKNDTTQLSVVLSDLSPSSADTHTLTNT